MHDSFIFTFQIEDEEASVESEDVNDSDNDYNDDEDSDFKTNISDIWSIMQEFLCTMILLSIPSTHVAE